VGRDHTHGASAVHVLDGSDSSYSNLGEREEEAEKTMSVFDVKLHVLGAGNRFNLQDRRPEVPPDPQEEVGEKVEETPEPVGAASR
jgi:cyanophycinase